MKITSCVKTFVAITIAIFLYSTIDSTVHAASSNLVVNSREDWLADDNVLAFEENYAFPNSLIVIPISIKSSHADSLLGLKELYYYFATRSTIGDLPFHYIVSSDGQIYAGNKLGDEAAVNLSSSNGSIIIGYLQDENASLTISSVNSLKNIILQVINKFAISPEKVTVKNLQYTQGKKGEIEEASLVVASQIWQEDIALIIESLKKDYSPQEIVFKAELAEVKLPEEEQEVAQTAEVKVKIKNIGDINLYSGTTSNIYVTRRDPLDASSKFYLVDEWASPSRVGLLKEGERLEMGAERECTFKVYVPLYPPEIIENFILVGPNGSPIEGSEFSIKLKIKKPDKQILEITETEIGYLNVRSSPGLGEVITKASPGERFLVLDYQSGYYKININGKEGWVVNMYVKVVSS